jgi:excisionase family DNA binding protein
MERNIFMADLLTTRQVQDLLKIDRTTIYRMVESGQLPAVRVGKQWRFARMDLEQLLNGAKMTAEAKTPPAPVLPVHPLSPPANGEQPLQTLLPLAAAQMIQDVMADALGVTMVITDMASHPVTQVSNPCGLYHMLLADEEAVTHCIHEWQRLAGAVTLEPKFSPNDLGLLCARGLIRSGNLLKGMLFAGGIAPDQWPPTRDVVKTMAAQFKLAPQTLAPHIDEVYRLDRRQRERVLSFIQRIADVFSLLLEDRSRLGNDAADLVRLFAMPQGQSTSVET